MAHNNTCILVFNNIFHHFVFVKYIIDTLPFLKLLNLSVLYLYSPLHFFDLFFCQD